MYTFIDSIEDLAILNSELLNKQFIGIDTEFRRTTKDNMRLALLQVNDGEEIYLIDTILIDQPGNNCEFLFSKAVIKILHSCKEDLEAIYSWTYQEMVNIFDTQIANSFLDGEYSIGYQGLVEKKLSINLDKNETRSNWIRRPLTDSQLKYAALDVEYLIHLYLDQKNELENSQKLNWFNQEIKKITENTFSNNPNNLEMKRVIPILQENTILKNFNEVIERISKRELINPTLFFSKKAQKDFIRLIFIEGVETAFDNITEWRKSLIKKEVLELLK